MLVMRGYTLSATKLDLLGTLRGFLHNHRDKLFTAWTQTKFMSLDGRGGWLFLGAPNRVFQAP
jgi:hypothetical protein